MILALQCGILRLGRGWLTSQELLRRAFSAFSCPLAGPCKRPIEGGQVLPRQSAATFRGLLVDAEGEASIGVAELLADVDGIAPQRRP